MQWVRLVAVGIVSLILHTTLQAQYTYTNSNGTITITKYTGTGGDVVIPSTLVGLPVTSIEKGAFSRNTNLTSLVIPASVTNVAVAALTSCPKLGSITVEVSSLSYTSVDGVLFSKDVSILVQCPGGKAGAYAIPSGVTTMGSGAFWGCDTLVSIAIPSSLVSIPISSMQAGSSFTTITVDESNPSFSSIDGVLYDKTGVTLLQCPLGRSGKLEIPSQVRTIADSSFSGCTNLTGVTIPEAVTVIERSAFSACKGLTNLVIPNGVTSIGDSCFIACWGLVSITLPNTITNMGGSAFSSCQGLREINIPSSISAIPDRFLHGGISLLSLTIPSNITSIGERAFYDCRSMTNLTILEGVANIGSNAFWACDGLRSVTIPTSVVSVGDRAFLGCMRLESVFFKGDAPSAGPTVFTFDRPLVFYLPSKSGWGGNFSNRPSFPWDPVIQTGNSSVSVTPNGFGFRITGSQYDPIVIEATTDLVNQQWIPLQTNTLTGDPLDFVDPDSTNHVGRFYRIRSP